jgi:hypothetical protein
MTDLSPEEKKVLRRIADEPRYWVQQFFPDLQQEHQDKFFDLVDRLKALWQEARETRIDLCFALRIVEQPTLAASPTIRDVMQLQTLQQNGGARLVFELDLNGQVVDDIELDSEIDPVAVQNLSQMRGIVVFWVGAEFQIFCKGAKWNPNNKKAVLREIKSKKRDSLLLMANYENVIRAHFDNYVRDEARVDYWFERNKLLLPSPEKIFQKSLWSFLDREVDCEAAREPMFKDSSRCDIKVVTDNYDLYFIEIKWIGRSAVRKRGQDVITGATPQEFPVKRAIQGAEQTRIYIEKNNAIEFEHRVKLGIYVVYDAYSPPKPPIKYGPNIAQYPLLKPLQFALQSIPPSKAARSTARIKSGC